MTQGDLMLSSSDISTNLVQLHCTLCKVQLTLYKLFTFGKRIQLEKLRETFHRPGEGSGESAQVDNCRNDHINKGGTDLLIQPYFLTKSTPDSWPES